MTVLIAMTNKVNMHYNPFTATTHCYSSLVVSDSNRIFKWVSRGFVIVRTFCEIWLLLYIYHNGSRFIRRVGLNIGPKVVCKRWKYFRCGVTCFCTCTNTNIFFLWNKDRCWIQKDMDSMLGQITLISLLSVVIYIHVQVTSFLETKDFH